MAKATVKTSTRKASLKASTAQAVEIIEAPVAPVMPTSEEWIDAGFGIGATEAKLIALMDRLAQANPCTAEMQESARRFTIVGYLMSKMTDGWTEEHLSLAEAIYDGHTHTVADENMKPGKIRRTPEQDRDYGAGKQRWSRNAKKSGLALLNGNAGNDSAASKGEPAPRETDKPAPRTSEPEAEAVDVKPRDKGELLHRVHDVATAIRAINPDCVALLAGDAALLELHRKAQAAWLEFETVLARSPK